MLYVRHVCQSTLVTVAKIAGVRLSLGSLRWGVGFLQVFDSQFELLAVPGVTGKIARFDLDWGWNGPSEVLISGLEVNAKGDPERLYQSLSLYVDRLSRLKFDSAPNATPPKLEIRHLNVRLESTHPVVPNFYAADLSFSKLDVAGGVQSVIKTSRTTIGTTELGPLSLVIRPSGSGLDVGWGSSLESSVWTLSYQIAATGKAIAFRFNPTKLTDLFQRFGSVKLPMDNAGASVSGSALVHFDDATATLSGTTDLTLLGFVPPHPDELKGYAFADRTELRVTFLSRPLYDSMELPLVKLKNGDITFIGNGRVVRNSLSARIVSDLKATLDCTTLAKGFAKEDIGGTLGQWGNLNAKQLVRGGVDIRVQLDADTNHLADAKVVKRIGIGCGLRPISLIDLLSLGLPPLPDARTAERIIKRLPKDVSISDIASVLPTLDEIINVNLKAVPGRPRAGTSPSRPIAP